jgi:hypothetical protein
MNRSLIATAILIGATTLGLTAHAQTTVPPAPTVTPTPTGVPVQSTGGGITSSTGGGIKSTTGGGITSTGGGSTGGTPASPPKVPGTVHRDEHQQQRIENGLQNGTITTREGAELEQNQARINQLQAKDMQSGSLSSSERQELDRLQNQQSRAIAAAHSNGVNGNPMSASSQREQAAVQRNINQQNRIQEGVHDNSLSTQEAGRLEAAQGRADQHEYNAGRDGKVTAHEGQSMQQQDNRHGQHIYKQRHDKQEGKR